MANAKQLPSGAWRVLVYDGKDTNGKRIYTSFTAPTEREANFMALDHQLHHKSKQKVTEMLFQEALQQYIEKIQKQNESNMLYHGDFFSLLEGLEYIKEITYLKLELYGSKSNQFGDSTIPPYGKVYLRNCYFNMTYES